MGGLGSPKGHPRGNDMTIWAQYEGITVEEAKTKYHHEKNARLKERYLAVKLSYQGYQCEEIAHLLDRNPITIRAWLQTFNARGFAGLTFQPIPGRPGKLTAPQKQALKKNGV